VLHQLARSDIRQNREVSEGEAKLPLVLPVLVQKLDLRFATLSAFILESKLVFPGLTNGVPFGFQDAALLDLNFVKIAALNVGGIPPLDLNHQDAQVRGEDDEVGVAVADDRLVVNEIVVRESLQDVKQSYLIGA
jgi:hypothetical protein